MSSQSSLQDIHDAIEHHNPFDFRSVVKYQDVWNLDFVDVEVLHAHASNHILQQLETVSSCSNKNTKATSIVVIAEQGSGKTHIIRRIHRHLYHQGSTFFIYMSFARCSDSNLIHYEFRQAIVDSLLKPSNHGVSQWQVLATKIIQSTLRDPSKQPQDSLPASLVQKFDKIYANYKEKGQNLIDSLVAKTREVFPDLDPYVLRAIIWTLSKTQGAYAINWLRGDELSLAKTEELGLPSQPRIDQACEPESFKIVLTILKLLTEFQPVLICFDETDTALVSDSGLLSSQLVAYLIKQIFDSLEHSDLSRGLVLVSFFFPSVWRDQIRQLAGVSDRILAGSSQPIQLGQLDEDSFAQLVELLLKKKLYEPRNLLPPSPFYPFEEEEIRKLGKTERPPIRRALRWCAENFKIRMPIKSSIERFEEGLTEKLNEDDLDNLDDNATIADALRYGFELLIGKLIQGETGSGEVIEAKVISAVSDIQPKSKNNGYINFCLVGTEKDKPFAIGVAVLQQTNGNAFGAGLSRLIDYTAFGLSRGCLVRSKERKISKKWSSYEQYERFIRRQGGEHIELDLDQIKPLLAIKSMFDNRSIYQLDEPEIRGFCEEIALKNDLLREILSDPPGCVDPSMIDDEELIQCIFSDDDPEVELETDDEVLMDLLSPETFDFETPDSLDSQKSIASGVDDLAVPIDSAPDDSEKLITPTIQGSQPSLSFTGKKIQSFTLFQRSYPVTGWRDLFMGICEILAEKHGKIFVEKALMIKGKKPYFSASAEGFRSPKLIGKTNLYVETDFSANNFFRVSCKVLQALGYDEQELSIQTIDRLTKDEKKPKT